MLYMAKKKPGKDARGPRPGRPVGLRIDETLAAALDAYIGSTSPRVSRTAALETALQRFLAEQGFWPPAGQEGGRR